MEMLVISLKSQLRICYYKPQLYIPIVKNSFHDHLKLFSEDDKRETVKYSKKKTGAKETETEEAMRD